VKRAFIAVVLAAAASVALLASLLAGWGGDTARATPTYFQDVKPILDGRCAGCHYDGGIGPFALTSYEEARAQRLAVANAVTRRQMPPWHAERGVRAYRHDPSLTDEQISTVADWAVAGAPAGDPGSPGAGLPPVGARLSRADLRLPMPEAYTPRRSADADDYRCFVLDWSPTAPTYVTGVNVMPGTPEQVHHIILFLAPPGSDRTLEGWDEADPGAGYGCYGGPSATLAGAGESLRAPQFVSGWVPGSTGGDLPAGTGLLVPTGARLILQAHYNLEQAAPRADRSEVELSVAKAVERPGLYVPLVNPLWVLEPESFSIPAGKNGVRHEFEVDPSPYAAFLAPSVDLTEGFEIHRVALHMHRLGVSGEVAIERTGGQTDVLLEIPRWDFHWQREYQLAQPAGVDPGDHLALRCEHDNTSSEDRLNPREVTWGEDSSDEMCIAFLYVTPS
jgi:mono/diheme cytochrome c family protein